MVIIFLKTLEKKKGVSDVRSKNIERQLVRTGRCRGSLPNFMITHMLCFYYDINVNYYVYNKHRTVEIEGPHQCCHFILQSVRFEAHKKGLCPNYIILNPSLDRF